MGQLEVTGTSRASFAMYNTMAEVDLLSDVLQRLVSTRAEARTTEASTEQEGGTTIEFAKAKAETAQAAADDLAEEFLDFDDRESKTELLMELGQEVPDYFEPLKAISQAVPGCMSEVYLVGRPLPSDPHKFEFAADSNAEIVRGLIAVLQQVFSGQSAQEVIDFDIESFFRKIGLDQFISTQRRSGLDGMIRRIRTLAQAILERETT
jgi:cysteine desulfurase/selenocysteine lyase